MLRPGCLLVFVLFLGGNHILLGAEPRTDRYGDPLPEGAIARLGTVRYRWSMHSTPVFAPDGKTLISCGWDNTIRIWEATTGKLLRSWPAHEQRINSLAVAPDGKTLATASEDRTVRWWETATGREIGRFRTNKEKPDALAFSPDGRTLAIGRIWGTITLVESPSGKEIRTFKTAGDNLICSLAFTPDGKGLASGHHSAPLRLWDVKSGEEECRFKNSEWQLCRLGFTANGKYLLGVSWSREGVAVWDTSTGKEVRRFKDCDPDFALLAEGTKVATNQIEPSGRRIISIRRMDSGEEVQRLAGHQGGFGLALCCPDGKTLVSFGADFMVRQWDTVTGKELTKRRPMLDDAPRHAINFAAFSPDGKTVLSADSGLEKSTIRFWNPLTAVETRRLSEERDYFGTRVLSPDGKTLAAVADSGSGKERRWRIRLVDAATGKERRSLNSEDEWVNCLCFSPDSKTLFAAAGETVRFWNIATGKESRPDVTNKHWHIIEMACSPDGETLALAHNESGIREATMVTFLSRTGKQKENGFSTGFTVFQSLAFSPHGRFLAVGSRHGSVLVLDASSAKRQQSFSSAGGLVVFSPDSRLLATSGMGRWGGGESLASTICVWELATGRQRCRFTGHLDPVQALAFSPDGRLLVSGSQDTTLLVWDMMGVAKGDRSRPLRLSAARLFECWEDLGAEGTRVHRAIGDLVAADDRAVEFLRQRLPLLSSQDKKRIAELIAALDQDRFADRERATKELATLGATVLPDLLRTLESHPSPEVRRRVEKLVEKSRLEEEDQTSASALRRLRAIEILEHIDSVGARRALRDLSERGSGVRCRHEAREALQRLTRGSPER
ncbi:MAG TPA: hypothetical protein VH643_23485 [Gemmataceae bacterium]|jgi:WD40 repeat protein